MSQIVQKRHDMETNFHIIGPKIHWWIFLAETIDTQLSCFFNVSLNMLLDKWSSYRLFKTPWHSTAQIDKQIYVYKI